MFQKLEKDLKKISYAKINKSILLTSFFLISFLNAQVNQKFEIFDWEIIGKKSSVNSITEGYKYIYFATYVNGILRYNKFSRSFDESLYLGQGLISKKIKHVYFDKSTSILWSVGDMALEFSSSRVGNWNNVNYSKLSLNSYNDIIDIGSSLNFIWIKTSSGYIKLDHINGSFLGIFLFPDEKKIFWGDSNFKYDIFFKEIDFENYFVEEGWLLSQNFAIDSNGISVKYISTLKTENGHSWIGLTNGYIMLVDSFSKTIKPINFGFDTAIPITISFKKEAWLAGIRDKKLSSVTSISEDFNEIRNFSELNYSNFFNGDFFSSKIIDNEVWFGSTGAVLIYNKEKDFFRTLGYEKDIPVGRIYFIENLRNSILIGSKKDLVIIDKLTKKRVNSTISNFVKKNNTYIDDLEMDKDNIYLISDNKLYQFDMNENINFSKLNDKFKFISVFVTNEIKYFVTNKGIINSENDSIIPSSLYFNYQINDIVEFKDYIFIGTNKGLIVYDNKYNRLDDFYNFSFLENIYDMEQIGKYLVLLSNSGLIKLNLQL
tara:strand:+ start:1054 stop:2688 length:1635 start_codon:yes stop_codon:yes gene_type:complete